MKKGTYVLLFGLITLLFSCTKITYWTDHTENIDFGDYQTYQIDKQCSDYNPGVNPINQQRIKNAIELSLRGMGYTRSDDPDLNIKFFVKNETKYFYEQCLTEYDDIEGGGRCIDKVYTYEEGTLVIDLIDVRKNIAIWHGGASSESWESMDNPDEKIKEMVGSIMKSYESLIEDGSYVLASE